MKKIAITGPESSGKTTLAQLLATHFQTVWVPEFARTYLSDLNRPYTLEDLEIIAEGQLALEKAYPQNDSRLIFCDTDICVLKIWSEFRFGTCSTKINNAFQSQIYDHTLLCRPDIEWVPDPLRENPHDRDLLFDKFIDLLNQKKASYTIIEGDAALRFKTAVEAVESSLDTFA